MSSKLTHWDYRFLDLAQHVAGWSKDPSTKVGAVITDNNKIVSIGFNGLPQGVQDLDERLQNRDLKYKMIVHGEVNAMNFAERSIRGCTLYTWPFMPCPICAGQVIQRGISKIITLHSDNPRWVESFKISQEMFSESGVELMTLNNSAQKY